MAKKEAWLVRWEAEVARWKATPSGKATSALYIAAEKAGMVDELRNCQPEVIVETWQGKTSASLTWERELQEREDFVFPETAYARAEEWLKKYANKQGWETV